MSFFSIVLIILIAYVGENFLGKKHIFVFYEVAKFKILVFYFEYFLVMTVWFQRGWVFG